MVKILSCNYKFDIGFVVVRGTAILVSIFVPKFHM